MLLLSMVNAKSKGLLIPVGVLVLLSFCVSFRQLGKNEAVEHPHRVTAVATVKGASNSQAVFPSESHMISMKDMDVGPKCSATEKTFVEIPSDSFIPVFILTRDRVEDLKRVFESYKHFTSPHEVVLIDHNSTFPPMVQYLEELEEAGTTIHRLPEYEWEKQHKSGSQNQYKAALKASNTIINKYLDKRPDIKYYAFADPDISMAGTAPDALLFWAGLLETCEEMIASGPMQLSSNIFDPAMRMDHAWKHVPNVVTWNEMDVHVHLYTVGTTFAMRRRGTRLERNEHKMIRSYGPYASRHLDLYEDPAHYPAGKLWYLNRADPGVNHW